MLKNPLNNEHGRLAPARGQKTIILARKGKKTALFRPNRLTQPRENIGNVLVVSPVNLSLKGIDWVLPIRFGPNQAYTSSKWPLRNFPGPRRNPHPPHSICATGFIAGRLTYPVRWRFQNYDLPKEWS
jgi:hypothetical protein